MITLSVQWAIDSSSLSFCEIEVIQNKADSILLFLPASHKLLPYQCVCVRACGCTLLNDRFNDEMQLAWPTSNVGFFPLRNISSLPPTSSCVPLNIRIFFLLRIPLEACFFGHTVDTPHAGCKFLHPFCGFFNISFVKTVCKGNLREFPTQACKIPLSLVREMHAAAYLSSQGGWERSRLVSLTNYSSVCGLLNVCFRCIHGLHTGAVDMNSLVKGKGKWKFVPMCLRLISLGWVWMKLNTIQPVNFLGLISTFDNTVRMFLGFFYFA